MKVMRRGDGGLQVRDAQQRLHDLGFREAGLEGELREGFFGEATERAVRLFQEQRRMRVDGIIGEQTWMELVEASYRLGDRFLYLTVPPFRGDDVREAQRFLNSLGFPAGKEDGIFGRDTEAALRDFQGNVGLKADGILGSSTIRALQSLRPAVKPLSVAEVREKLSLRKVRRPRDLHVALTAAPEGNMAELAALVAMMLHGLGATVSTEAYAGEDDEGRLATWANESGAGVMLALLDDPRPPGINLYYFAGAASESPEGKRLASLIAAKLAERGPGDREVLGKSFRLVRETRMPCVALEGRLSLPEVNGAAEAVRDALCAWLAQ